MESNRGVKRRFEDDEELDGKYRGIKCDEVYLTCERI